jgi:hypothetical protein
VHPTAQHHPASRRLFGANSWPPLVLQDRTVRQHTPISLQDAADLAAAGLDALGLGGVGQGIQGPMRRRLGIGGLEAAVGWRTSPDINAPAVRSLAPVTRSGRRHHRPIG